MVKQNGGYSDFAPIPTILSQICAKAEAVSVEPDEQWDAASKTMTPRRRTLEDGSEQSRWVVSVLVRPNPGDERHSVAIVPIKIWSAKAPQFREGMPLSGNMSIQATPWHMQNGGFGVAWSADQLVYDDTAK